MYLRVCMHLCIYVYVCAVCMYVCMYVCMCVNINLTRRNAYPVGPVEKKLTEIVETVIINVKQSMYVCMYVCMYVPSMMLSMLTSLAVASLLSPDMLDLLRRWISL